MPHRWDPGYVSEVSDLRRNRRFYYQGVSQLPTERGVLGVWKTPMEKNKNHGKPSCLRCFFCFFGTKNIASPPMDVFFLWIQMFLCAIFVVRKLPLIPFDQLMYESTFFVESEVWLICLSLSMYRSSLIYWAVLSDEQRIARDFPTKWRGKDEDGASSSFCGNKTTQKKRLHFFQ